MRSRLSTRSSFNNSLYSFPFTSKLKFTLSVVCTPSPISPLYKNLAPYVKVEVANLSYLFDVICFVDFGLTENAPINP